ncbi:MAG: T9SS type A sorting domain-containing protein [Saprospiraceae bacterium]
MINAQTFDCPCTGGGAINVDAGSGTNVTALTDIWSVVVSGVLSNTCLAIKGRLLINSNLTIYDGDIFMQPGAEIVVLSGKTLTIGGAGDGVDISGCEEMWRSITINSGGRLLLEECTIEDAQWAVRTDANGMASGSMRLFGNVFKNNHISIFIPPPTGIPFNTFASVLHENLFTADTELLPNFDNPLANYDNVAPFAAMDVSRVNNFGIVGHNNPEEGIDSHRNGVISRGQHGVGFFVSNMYMSNFVGGTTSLNIDVTLPSGIGVLGINTAKLEVYESIFNGMNRGIYTTNSNLIAQDNFFEENYIGVQFDNGNNRRLLLSTNEFNDYDLIGLHIRNARSAGFINIYENYFNHTHAFNLLTLGAPETWGIYINGLSANTTTSGNKQIRDNVFNIGSKDGVLQLLFDGRYQVTGNDIDYGSGDAGTLGQIGAIHLSQSTLNFLYDNTFLTGTSVRGSSCITLSGAPKNVLCCNTTRNTAWGMRFSLMGPDNKLIHSTFGAHDVATLTCSSVMGQQIHAGNLWQSNSKVEHTGTPSQVTGSKFFVELPIQLPLWPVTTLGVNAAGWFDDLGGSAPENCASDTRCNPPMLTDDEAELEASDIFAATGAYDDSDYDEMLNWEAARQLYDKLERDTHLLGDTSVVDSFKTAADLTEIGAFYAIDAGVATLDVPTPVEQGHIDSYLAMIEALTAELYTLDSLYALATIEKDWDDITTEKEKVLEDLIGPMEDLLDLYDLITTRSLTTASDLWDDNEIISPSNLPAENLQIVNRIFLSTVAAGIMTLTNGEFDDISDIAWQCPLEGGHAVLGARALYQLRQYASFNDSLICGISLLQRPGLSTQAASAAVQTLFPNPTSGELTLVLQSEITGSDLLIRVTNLAGQEMLQIQEPEASSSIRINAGTLPEGLYLLSVYQADQRISSHKIAIIK